MKKSIAIWSILLAMVLTLLAPAAFAEEEPAWSAAYREFVLNDGFLSSEDLYGSLSDYSFVKFGLYDLNRDGIFELIAHSGTGKVKYIYTFEDNMLKRIGSLAYELPCRYLPDSQYPGLFNFGGDTGMYSSTYVIMENGILQETEIYGVLYRMNDTTRYPQTDDEALYQTAISVCEQEEGEELSVYTIEEIRSMGWESFIAQYLTAPVILEQPTAAADENSDTIEIAVDAEGDDLAYAWEYSDDDGVQWIPADCEEPVISIPKAEAVEGRLYRCAVFNAAGRRYSEPVKITSDMLGSAESPEPEQEPEGSAAEEPAPAKRFPAWIVLAAGVLALLALILLLLLPRVRRRKNALPEAEISAQLKETPAAPQAQAQTGPKFCPRCGARTVGGEVFCTKCGHLFPKR